MSLFQCIHPDTGQYFNCCCTSKEVQFPLWVGCASEPTFTGCVAMYIHIYRIQGIIQDTRYYITIYTQYTVLYMNTGNDFVAIIMYSGTSLVQTSELQKPL